MYKNVSKLLIYGDMEPDSILMQLSDIFRCMDEESQTKEVLTTRVFRQIKRILQVATDYGFDENLWHNYLTFLLITNENPFSITCEKVGAREGSVNYFAENDFRAFKELFDYDFSKIEEYLGVDCFSRLSDYKAIGKPELMYNKNVSEKVRALSRKLEQTRDEHEFSRWSQTSIKLTAWECSDSIRLSELRKKPEAASLSERSTIWIRSRFQIW